MGIKDVKKGIEIATKPNIDFMKKQEDATREVGKRVIKKINEVGEVIEIIIDDLSAMEKRRLYGLETTLDIIDFDIEIKEMLCSILFTLATEHSQNSESQQNYFSTVKRYVGINNLQTTDISLVENLSNKYVSKAFLQTMCEFLFLYDCTDGYIEKFNEVIECFHVNTKNKKEIFEHVNNLYNALGITGLIEHFGYVEEDEVVSAESDIGASKTIDFDSLSEEYIDTSITIGKEEKKVFNNKTIYVNADVICNGELEFENCKIIYNTEKDTPHSIEMLNNSKLKIYNCDISSKYNKDSIFISADDGSSNIEIKNSNLINCNNFLYLHSSSEESSLELDKCFISDSINKVLDIDSFNIIMKNSKVEFSYNKINLEGSYDSIFEFRTYNGNSNLVIDNVQCIGSKFISNAESFRWMFEVSHNLHSDGNALMRNCKFLECDNIIEGENISIINSEFEKCHRIFEGRNSKIEGCSFNNIASPFYSDRWHSYVNLSFSVLGEKTSLIKGCTFTNIFLTKGSFVKGQYFGRKIEHVVDIEKCIFKNCSRFESAGDFIKIEKKDTTSLVDRLRGLRFRVATIYITDCKGLDSIGELAIPIDIENIPANLDLQKRSFKTELLNFGEKHLLEDYLSIIADEKKAEYLVDEDLEKFNQVEKVITFMLKNNVKIDFT